jgi:hypothetical protein
LLAKIANDDVGHQVPRGVLAIFASKLAPTGTGKWVENDLFIAIKPFRFALAEGVDGYQNPCQSPLP